MHREVDYVILGAGIAGMTLQHMLRGESAVLLDPSPGRYKIGESIIPQHFIEPEVRPLFEIVKRLPSATPKDGTLFVSDDSIGGFEPFVGGQFTIHVARQELEEATAKFFGTEVTRERVDAIDVDARIVTTDQGTFLAKKLIVDCSGPARLVARALGLSREVWPVWAAWAYHDVDDANDERLFDLLRRGEKQFFRYNERLRCVEPSTRYDGFHPSHCTVLTHVGDGTWTWQIPLHGARMLSVGVVSRHGPVSAEQYAEVTSRSIAPQYRTNPRETDGSTPFNRFHVRNRFAWASDRFAGETWALVGDAAFFGDPVYSVGTGFATNHAIQLGRILRDRGWSSELAAAHHRQTANLFERAKRAYDWWYFGKVVADQSVAIDVQTDFLNGRAFQVQTLQAYSEMWLVSHEQDTWNGADPGRGANVLDRIEPLLDEGGVLGGWRLVSAGVFEERVELEWDRPDAKPMGVVLERQTTGRRCFRAVEGLGLWYRREGADTLDGQGQALVDAMVTLLEREGAVFRGLLDGARA
jgi:flavin-dependent dehydrogenase